MDGSTAGPAPCGDPRGFAARHRALQGPGALGHFVSDTTPRTGPLSEQGAGCITRRGGVMALSASSAWCAAGRTIRARHRRPHQGYRAEQYTGRGATRGGPRRCDRSKRNALSPGAPEAAGATKWTRAAGAPKELARARTLSRARSAACRADCLVAGRASRVAPEKGATTRAEQPCDRDRFLLLSQDRGGEEGRRRSYSVCTPFVLSSPCASGGAERRERNWGEHARDFVRLAPVMGASGRIGPHRGQRRPRP